MPENLRTGFAKIALQPQRQDGAKAGATLRLHVIDKDGFVLGSVACRVGLRTYYGSVTRFTDRTLWTRGKSGVELKHRKYDGNLPCVYKSHVSAAEVVWNN